MTPPGSSRRSRRWWAGVGGLSPCLLLRRCFPSWKLSPSRAGSAVGPLQLGPPALLLQEMGERSPPSSSPPSRDLSVINQCGCYHACPPSAGLDGHAPAAGSDACPVPPATSGLGCPAGPPALPAEPAGEARGGLPVLRLPCPANRNPSALPGPLRLCPMRNVAVADMSRPKAGQKSQNTEVLC